MLEISGELFLSLLKIEEIIARYIRKYVPGYDYIAIFYKALAYLIISKKSDKCKVIDGFELKDCADQFGGTTFFGYYDRAVRNDFGDFIVINKKDKKVSLNILTKDQILLFKYELQIWNYQQGVLASWVNNNEIIFNAYNGLKVVACIANIRSGEISFLDHSFQALSKSREVFCAIDLSVLRRIRPEYSYKQCPFEALESKKNSLSIFTINDVLLGCFSFESICKLAFKDLIIHNFKLNHCVFSPDGNRLIFLARGWEKGEKRHSLMLLCMSSFKLISVVTDELVSHYNWLSNLRLVYWGTFKGEKSYHIIDFNEDNSFNINSLIGDFTADGHPSPISDNKFVSDTYPNRSRLSELKLIEFTDEYLSDVKTIGVFKQPLKFFGEKRVDLHPRYESNNSIYFDSGHTGFRRLYKVSSKV